MIEIIKDVDIITQVKNYDVVIIGCNIYCTMANGAQREIALHYPYVRERDMQTKYGDPNKIGTLIECTNNNQENPIFVIAYICKGYPPRPKSGELIDYLEYDALKKCLEIIKVKYKDKKIACPLLGNSRFDGNGDKTRILEIFNEIFNDNNSKITIFDYHQLTRGEKLKKIREKELEVKEKDRELYYQMVKKRKAEAEELFKLNGFAHY